MKLKRRRARRPKRKVLPWAAGSPPEACAAIGGFPDVPEQAKLRNSYGADSPRESIE